MQAALRGGFLHAGGDLGLLGTCSAVSWPLHRGRAARPPLPATRGTCPNPSSRLRVSTVWCSHSSCPAASPPTPSCRGGGSPMLRSESERVHFITHPAPARRTHSPEPPHLASGRSSSCVISKRHLMGVQDPLPSSRRRSRIPESERGGRGGARSWGAGSHTCDSHSGPSRAQAGRAR